MSKGYWSVIVASAAIATSLGGCGGDDSSGNPSTGGSSGAGGAAGAAGSAGADAGWINPGCTGTKNVASTEFEDLDVQVDLSTFAAGEYQIKQTVTLRPDTAGDTVTLFGAALLLGEASHGYAYDGQSATFCVGAYQANDPVTLSVSYVVSTEHQNFPAGNLAGIKVWGNPSGSFAIGAYSAPFFAATWLLAPHTMPWIDAQHSGTASVRAAKLAVRVPDTSWSVVGPGKPEIKADTWSFAIQGRMPLYALAFAASPNYVQVDGGKTSGGVELTARVHDASKAKVGRHLDAARTGVEWMDSKIGKYSWPTALTFAEVPGYPGGFEHTSAVWLGSVTIDGGNQGDYVAVHEAVHHWWGNDVQAADWPHFWLSEGFTEWTTVFGILPTLDAANGAALQKKYRDDAARLSYPAKPSDPNPGPLRFPDGADFAVQLNQNGQLFYRYGAAFLEMVNQRLQRDHATDLVAILKDWYAEQQGKSATTEQFRDFLISKTSSNAWTQLFDEWVYVTPCPMLEFGSYSYGSGQVSFEVRRTGGANQALPSVDLVLGGSPQQTTTVTLPKGVDKVQAQVTMATPPSEITVDPKGLYVLRLATETGWTGPKVDSALP